MITECSAIYFDFSLTPLTSGYQGVTVFNLYGSLSSTDVSIVSAQNINYSTYQVLSDDTGIPYIDVELPLISSVGTDFFLNSSLYTGVLYGTSTLSLSTVATVTDAVTCTFTSVSSLTLLEVPSLSTTVSGSNLIELTPVSFDCTPGSDIVISASGLYADDTHTIQPYVVRVETHTGTITSFYAPNTYPISITEFGEHTISVSGFPLLSSEVTLDPDSGYLNQFNTLGFTAPDTDTYYFTNTAYAVAVTLSAYPKFDSTIPTLTGYAPSLYASNTGTIFEFFPIVDFTNNTGVTLTSNNTSVTINGELSGINTYDTYAEYPILHASLKSAGTKTLNLFAQISGIEYPYLRQAQDSVTLVFVDPPVVTFDIQSDEFVTQGDDIVVLQDITFVTNITNNLPYAYHIDTGEGPVFTGYSQATSIDYTVITAPGLLVTATLSVFPLLTASTDWAYITGTDRIDDTGVLPIVLSQGYVVGVPDAEVPLDNLAIDYHTTSITYNNKTVTEKLVTDASAASALICKNQFDQIVSPTITLSGYLKDSDTYTLADLSTIITEVNDIYLTLNFNNNTDEQTFDVDTSTDISTITTTAPYGTQSITLSARPKNSLAITAKTIPYTGKYFDFITATMYFSKFVPSWYASILNPNAFEVTIWNDSQHTIDQVQTYVQGSNSYPYDSTLTRYSRLLPQWWFQDANNNISETYPVNNTKIYNSFDNTYIGTSGISTFYFKDDTPTGPDGELLVVSPIVSGLIAPQDEADNVTNKPSYANPKQKTTQIYYVNNINPTKLNITRDGVRLLKPYYWYTNPIPNTITISNHEKLNDDYSIDFSYPYENGTHPYTIGISGVSLFDTVTAAITEGDNFTVSYTNTSFDITDELDFPITGFTRNVLSPTVSSGLYQLYASVSVQASGQYSHTPFAWVGDNKNNLISRILIENGFDKTIYEECQRNGVKRQYLSVPVSAVNNIIAPMALSGVSEVTNFAIDGLYNLWAVDGGNDVAYKVSVDGTILATISFPIGSSPAGVCIDSQQNVWFTLVDDISALKYTEDGEYITTITSSITSSTYEEDLLRPAGIDVDFDDNVWITFYNPMSSAINKYTSTGDLIYNISFPPYYTPVDCIVDGRYADTIWAITEFAAVGSNYNIGALHKIQDGTLQTVLTGFPTPTHFNIDANNNLWMLLGEKYVLQYKTDDDEYSIFNYVDNSFIEETTEEVVLQDNWRIHLDSPVNWWRIDISSDGKYQAAAGYSKNIYVSTDYGVTWSPREEVRSWLSIAMSQDGKYMAAGLNNGGIYISDDYGNTWSPSETVINGNINSIAINSTGQYQACLDTSFTTLRLYNSTDYGNTWTLTTGITGGPAFQAGVEICMSSTGKYQTLVAGTYAPGGLYKSDNYGSTWTYKDTRYWNSVAMSDSGQYQVAAAGYTGSPNWDYIYISKNYGDTWTDITQLGKKYWTGVDISSSGKYIIACNSAIGGRIYFSSDYGDTWSTQASNIAYPDHLWNVVRMSSDGTYQLAISYSGVADQKIYINTNPIQTLYTLDDIVNTSKFTGIGGHSDGSVWIIDNENDKVLVCDITDTNNLIVDKTVNVYPATPSQAGYYVNQGDWGSDYTVTVNPCFYEVSDADWALGVQAHGDWTGLRRTLKMCPENSISRTISGTSRLFEIKTSPPEFRVLNDSYNLSETLSNIFPQILKGDNNPVLHEQFLPGALGTDADAYTTIGRQFYEKIANFNRNHMDADFCNVNQLYSLAQMVGVTLDDYNLNYPADIQRAVDLLSIHFKRLYGEVDKYNKRLNSQTIVVNEANSESIIQKMNFDPNTPITTATTIITAGQSLVVYDNIRNSYEMLYINKTTQLKYLSGYGLRDVYNYDADTLHSYYRFYTYKDNEAPTMVNSFIDWNSSFTTVASSLSSMEEWYGQDGVIDQIFNYHLNKGLGFIET